MKVTAATITNAQIEQLRRDIAGRVFPASGMAHTGLSDLWNDTDVALASNGREACLDRGYSITPHDREQARQRCADAWNARHADDHLPPHMRAANRYTYGSEG